ncbi:MAG: class I SAM-dependent methyltransferase [Immundisolibacteraceae bacterium]|nr:class I SAM-dependent methyltransferase [Immundisolibacteraceae bacterium]
MISNEQQIINAWQANADPWAAAVRNRKIPSRVAVTDQAIIDACLQSAPQTGLDIGCGEGWLVRALAEQSVTMTGVDAVSELISAARRLSSDEFTVMNYGQIAGGAIQHKFDLVVCNFCLFGQQPVADLVAAIPNLLTDRGTFVLQTLHPETAGGDLVYKDGWRDGSWAGLGTGFTNPPPWYFRTLASWQKLITNSGLRLTQTLAPCVPGSSLPVSIIFSATAQKN